jgi:formylmethanofuran dehydrogenase subunit E
MQQQQQQPQPQQQQFWQPKIEESLFKKSESLFSDNSQKQTIFEIQKQLKEIYDSVKEIQNSIKKETNIYISQENPIKKQKQQSSFLQRKPINNQHQLPPYIINGEGICDKCGINELIHGFHYGENTDLCSDCFNTIQVQNRELWIEFKY